MGNEPGRRRTSQDWLRFIFFLQGRFFHASDGSTVDANRLVR
jgi:hypothetical protein